MTLRIQHRKISKLIVVDAKNYSVHERPSNDPQVFSNNLVEWSTGYACTNFEAHESRNLRESETGCRKGRKTQYQEKRDFEKSLLSAIALLFFGQGFTNTINDHHYTVDDEEETLFWDDEDPKNCLDIGDIEEEVRPSSPKRRAAVASAAASTVSANATGRSLATIQSPTT
uniref:Uncharacterized protein n=1 Tax=Romanomermis culicivorax TaxID=13658 RepID=A0A915L5V6_ROMCU